MALEYVLAHQEAVGRANQALQSSARRATTSLEFTTQGNGEAILPLQDFGVKFYTRPSVVFGFEMVTVPDPAIYKMPRVTAGIRRLTVEQAENGLVLYTQAAFYVAVDVALASSSITQSQVDASPLTCKLRHYAELRGMAYKNFDEAGDRFADLNMEGQAWSLASTNRENDATVTGFILGA